MLSSPGLWFPVHHIALYFLHAQEMAGRLSVTRLIHSSWIDIKGFSAIKPWRRIQLKFPPILVPKRKATAFFILSYIPRPCLTRLYNGCKLSSVNVMSAAPFGDIGSRNTHCTAYICSFLKRRHHLRRHPSLQQLSPFLPCLYTSLFLSSGDIRAYRQKSCQPCFQVPHRTLTQARYL